ncbi:MAG: TetR/AcrR family transcriptional regulator [Chitinophagales bacterium]|nr:TetR/AcrR family transcriptional regulator [Chitinophagales bacterium]
MDQLGKILLKAEELFFLNGLKNTSMDDLAKAMGMSKKTLYQFFDNKDDLVYKTMEHHMALEKEAINKIVSESSNAIEELFSIAKHVTGHLKAFNPMVIYDMQKYYPQAWALFHNYRDTFIYNLILDNINKGIGQGLYRQDFQPDIIAKIYCAKSDCIVDPVLFPFTQYNIIALYNEYFRYHIRGIASQEGIKYIEKQKTN